MKVFAATMVVVAGHDIKRDLQAVAGVHVFKCGAEAKVVLVTLNAVRVKVVTLSQSAPPHKKLKSVTLSLDESVACEV